MKKSEVLEARETNTTNANYGVSFERSIDETKRNAVTKVIRETIKKLDSTIDWIQANDNRSRIMFKTNKPLTSEEFHKYIPEMIEATAKALPEETLFILADQSALKGFKEEHFNGFYDGDTLFYQGVIQTAEAGFYCPDCGKKFTYLIDCEDWEYVTCEHCGKQFKRSELKYLPPEITALKKIVIK